MAVAIGYAGRKVTLSPHPMPASGWDTIVAFEAWQMAGKFPTYLGGVEAFADALEKMYKSLSGQAEIGALDGDFSLHFATAPRGGIEARASIVHDEGADDIRLAFRISIDQSYLPSIIEGLRSEFARKQQ